MNGPDGCCDLGAIYYLTIQNKVIVESISEQFMKPGQLEKLISEAELLGESVIIVTKDGQCFYREQDAFIHAEDIGSEVQYYYVEDYRNY